jgi:subfamily B ATP-binding cassette protein HlyB/CyaB
MTLVADPDNTDSSASPPPEPDAPKEVPLGGASRDVPVRDTGVIGLVMLARFHNIAADAAQIAHDFRESGKPLTVPQLLLAAKQLGLKARQVSTDVSRLPQTPLPALAIDPEGRFFILARVDAEQVLIQDPCAERPQVSAGAAN